MSRVQGCPRKRKATPSPLKKEVKSKTRCLCINAPLAIVGARGSGRKTLAYRFSRMHQGVLNQAVPIQYIYTASFQNVVPVVSKRISRSVMRIRAYIVDSPLELPPIMPPYYIRDWDTLCLRIFVWDVANRSTLNTMYSSLQSFRLANRRTNPFIVVGNKSDRRREPRDNGYTLMPFDTAAAGSVALSAETYLECSARNNEGVWLILAEIRRYASDPPIAAI